MTGLPGRSDLERLVSSLFPSGAAAVVATPEMYTGSLMDSERPGTERMVERRLREFTAGRSAARLALSKLGVPAVGIPRGPDRAPQWPVGVVGSIAHCNDLCVAAVSRTTVCSAIGIDAEPATPLDTDLLGSVSGSAERDHLCGLGRELGIDWPKVVFSVKESFYKAWFPVTGTPLEFTDVSVTIDPPSMTVSFSVLSGGPHAAWGRAATGRFETAGGFVVTGVTIPGSRT